MATYALGDIQGCFEELKALLDRINFDSRHDQLWFTGDLVNRGPQSLAVIEFVRALGDAAIVVLGNHDLHLLACATIDRFSPGTRDTFNDVLNSPACDEHLTWLRHQRLFYRDPILGYTLVHAGIPPQWTLMDAAGYAAEVEFVLHSDDFTAFFDNMYGNSPDLWDRALSGWPRIRLVTNYLTRLRYCSREGRIDFKNKGPVGSQPDHLIPWYDLYVIPNDTESIVFGHWSALHLSARQMRDKRIYALDTGAVWGGTLTAMRLEDGRMFSVPSTVNLAIDD